MNSVFTEEILAEKLSKLNSSQQCIETLSHWCIFHRTKAEQVVSTWDKQFHSSDMTHKVPLLYLANDILQNSKRNGNEFVTGFWNVLPSALKDIFEKGDDHGKSVVSRLVNIWEERRVFGSHAKSLKDVMLGEESPLPLEFGRKRSRSVRIVKRDSRTVKTKLTVGGTAEKIVTAIHLVLSEQSSESEEMNRCMSVVHRVSKMERDIDVALSNAQDPKRKTLAKELEEEEKLLKQSIDKLKVVEANRMALVSQLREALHEQESELENVRTQIQVAQAQQELASNRRKHLEDETYVVDSRSSVTSASSIDVTAQTGQTTKKTTAAIAAEVADMLAASSSSQYIMSSVLSTFAAEQEKNAGLTKSSTASTPYPALPNNATKNSEIKAEGTMLDPIVFLPGKQLNPSQNNLYKIPPATIQAQITNSQAQYHLLSTPPSQQYIQPSGGTLSSYAYGSFPPLPPGPPPPPPPPAYMMSPMTPLTQQQLQVNQQQPLTMSHQPSPLNQQHTVPLPPPPPGPSFRPVAPMQQPTGMVYYAHPHHTQ
ncbi:regulation of nuclear pre-mRNA domain-containing protein 1B [Coffea eugenioides]|uniref:Regulation of nuclear pre-mRNA domain-containing protein 1B-like n=1 Tax=Coffea arabica TaxID=13443 RepID=A0A6P6TNB7_COFAR|nr:regulation of nuclear pre-mRNA domain-containing protein 1B-like [Coffea arabica]XP_027179131.1 regulation of nuclear pre-mRNA domain-containing protein 1B [Coffea eugenioides]